MAATLYFAAFTSANTPTWARADIANGRHGFSATGYAASSSTTAGVPTSGSGDDTSVGITLTGLSAGTAYKVWLIWDDGTNTSNSGSPVGSAEFTTPVSYTLAASGGVALSGTAPLSQTVSFTLAASGGVLLSGAAQPARGTLFGAAGGVLLSGSASYITSGAGNFTLASSGGCSTSGAAAILRNRSMLSAGGITVSGVATPLTFSLTMDASGLVLLSGSAALNFQSILGGNARQRPMTGVGQ